MAARPLFSSLLVLCLLLLLPLVFSFTHLREDPELQQCRRRCQEEEGSRGERWLRECERTCEEEAWRRQSEREEREREGEKGGSRLTGEKGREEGDPQGRLQYCRRHCSEQHEDEGHRRRCQQWCEEKYREEMERREERGQEGEGKQQREEENPYFFGKQSFIHKARTEHGHFKVLQRFSKRSELLRGIDSYRLAVLKTNPNTFTLPSHWDAEEILYVVKGRGVITLLRGSEEGESDEGRESHEISEGDVLWVPAGTNVYLVNTDKNQRLHIAMVLKTISTPGEYREFFGVGGQGPESYFRVFSHDVLEAAFNTRREKLERVFGQQQKGSIVKASEEQIWKMSKSSSEEGGGLWPFGIGEKNKPFKLLKKKPSHANQHGQMYEVNQDECKQLRELDVDVSLANITAGSMIAPSYNSKATKLALVISGNGYIEMACPHIARQHQGVHYEKVRSSVSPGTVFVIPVGHPVVTVASGGENLQVLCFGLNAKNNRKYFLAGKNSLLRNLQKEAGELSMGVPWKEVRELLDAQKEAVFLKGPEKSREEGGGWRTPEYPILDLVGF